jgi:hypothetical protein
MAQQNTVLTFPEMILDFAFFLYRDPPCSSADAAHKAWPDAVKNLATKAEPKDWTGQQNNTNVDHHVTVTPA